VVSESDRDSSPKTATAATAAAQPDLSEFLAARLQAGQKCPWHAFGLSEEQQQKLTAAMATPEIPSTAIARVLKSWGFPTNDYLVRRHRGGECGTCRSN
jgi:hypothetical protein